MLKEIVELCFIAMTKIVRSRRALSATHDLNRQKDDLIQENQQV
jgi:hypothetical protein